MKKYTKTYREVFKLLEDKLHPPMFVQDHQGALVQILGAVRKTSNTYDVEFDCGTIITAGDEHAFMNSIGQPVLVKDIIPGEQLRTVTNLVGVKSRTNFLTNQEVYDICIPDPHWYMNDPASGIIHHNTSFGLMIVSAYLKKHKDAVLLFYDNEFGSPQSYFESFGIDTDRVFHTPFKSIEELKFDVMGQLEGLSRKDKVIIMIDSIGNAASKKEIDDALSESSKADMTRAKQLKSVFRMVTPYLTMLNIPMIAVNHTYATQEIYSKQVVSGGTGIYYSADTIWIIGRQQDKDGTEIQGYHFVINIEKSRFVKEKSKIPISVSWKGGIQKWSGLLDVAVEAGYVVKPALGWYVAVDPTKYVPAKGKPKDTDYIPMVGDLIKPHREKDTMSKEFWETVFTKTDFAKFISNKFSVAHIEMLKGANDSFESIQDIDLGDETGTGNILIQDTK